MKFNSMSIIALLLAAILSFTFTACATGGKKVPSAEITVTPAETILSPALFKKPIVVSGSGWNPGELVVVNMKLPDGVTVKGVEPGEDVGIASGNADEQGNLEASVGAITILMTFFQTGWDNNKMKPDMTQASPLPPGEYPLEAIGLESEATGGAVLTLLPPPEKKE
jgi:hypothetical protein